MLVRDVADVLFNWIGAYTFSSEPVSHKLTTSGKYSLAIPCNVQVYHQKLVSGYT